MQLIDYWKKNKVRLQWDACTIVVIVLALMPLLFFVLSWKHSFTDNELKVTVFNPIKAIITCDDHSYLINSGKNIEIKVIVTEKIENNK